MGKFETKTYFLSPKDVEIIWLDKKGDVITDSNKVCISYLWEAKFTGAGVNIDPFLVQRIKFPELKNDFSSSEREDYLVEVEVITDQRVIECHEKIKKMDK
jgi:hypothetical protein